MSFPTEVPYKYTANKDSPYYRELMPRPMFDAIFGGNNFADNANVQKIVNKLRAAQYTPVDPYNVKYYVDAYKATADNREFRGYSTGNTTIDVQRYLQ